jgi:iduronate 2-sulfatase
MIRHLFFLLFSIAALRAAERPNILFVAVDDLRPEFGAYGAKHIHSPNLDRLAKQGITFNRAYCQQAVCSPSRTSLMTGTRPDTNKVWDLETHFRVALPDVVTLGRHFKNHGYFVQGMGKIYHGNFGDPDGWSTPQQQPNAQPYGLPANMALQQRQNATPANAVAEKGSAAKKKKTGGRNTRGPAFEGADVPDETFADGQLARLAIAALGEIAKRKEPFFLAVGFLKPHLPFVAPKKYWDLYDPAKIQLAPNPFPAKDAPEYAMGPAGELRNYHGIPETRIPDDLARQLKHGYYASISYMDAQFGRVLDELERLGLAKNTIIVLWGDHGWKLGEHDAWCKHTNSENDTNSPLLLSVPGMKHAGARTDGLVEFVDVYPTLADLAGLPLPSHLEGYSFKPLLDAPTRPWKQAAFSQYPRPGSPATGGKAIMGYSMRTEHHRFTRWLHRDDHTQLAALELYDHRTDPQENTNLAHLPANRALVEKLTAQHTAGWRAALPAKR